MVLYAITAWLIAIIKATKNRIANSYLGISCPPMAILLCSNELAI